MGKIKLNESNERIGFVLSQIIIIALLIVDIVVFINQDSIIAKSLATVSFVGFMFLLLPSIKNFKNKKGMNL